MKKIYFTITLFFLAFFIITIVLPLSCQATEGLFFTPQNMPSVNMSNVFGSSFDYSTIQYAYLRSTDNGQSWTLYISNGPFTFDPTTNNIRTKGDVWEFDIYNSLNIVNFFGAGANSYLGNPEYFNNSQYFINIFNAPVLNFRNQAENYTFPTYSNGSVSYDPTLIQHSDLPAKVYFTPTLMIDDYNLKKSFKFNFEIEQIRPDTKYFVFLEDYTRNDYNSVTAEFQVLSVTTPEGYDYSNYTNYLYYDNRDKQLYLPAGCEINLYYGSGNNNTTIDLDLIDTIILPHLNLGALTSLTYSGSIFVGDYNYYSLIPTNYSISSNFIGNLIVTILNNLSMQIGGAPTSLRFNIANEFLQYLDTPMSIEEFRFQTYLNALYYGNASAENFTFDHNFNNFAFSNCSIVSYENTKYDNSVDNTYYHFYRSTNIYDQENKVNDNFYRFQYTDAEDVSSLLPTGIDLDYLTSPFYSYNYNSATGGFITYNITEIFYDHNNINYGVINSPLRVEPEPTFYDTNDTDNTILDNDTTEKIDKTSVEYWFNNIYKVLLDIQDTLKKIAKGFENFNSNITYDISRNFTFLFVPNPADYSSLLDNFNDLCEDHLGIVYQPFEFSYFILHEISIVTDFDTIAINIPAVYFHDVAVVPAYYFDFATIFENETFNNIHEFTLAGTDFMFIFMISSYAIEVFKEVFGSNDNN